MAREGKSSWRLVISPCCRVKYLTVMANESRLSQRELGACAQKGGISSDAETGLAMVALHTMSFTSEVFLLCPASPAQTVRTRSLV